MKKVLIIVDMQNDFTTGALGNDQCVKAIDGVAEVLNANAFDQIIFTRDTHHENYLETQEGKKLPVEHCIEGSEGWQIVTSLYELAKNKVAKENLLIFDKPTFGSAKLGQFLAEQYGDGHDVEFTFTGVCTGICVISNVSLAKAFCPEAKICVIAKACACVTEESHKTALAAMQTFQIDVVM